MVFNVRARMAREPATALRIAQQRDSLLRQCRSVVAEQVVLARHDRQAFHADRRRDDRTAHRHGLEHFQACAPADAQRNDERRGTRDVRPDVAHEVGEVPGVAALLGATHQVGGRTAADDDHVGVRLLAHDQRPDFVHEVAEAVDVRQPVHRPRKHDGLRGARRFRLEVVEVDAGRDHFHVLRAVVLLELRLVALRDCDDAVEGRQRVALELFDLAELAAPQRAQQRIARDRQMTLEDLRFDVVREQHRGHVELPRREDCAVQEVEYDNGRLRGELLLHDGERAVAEIGADRDRQPVQHVPQTRVVKQHAALALLPVHDFVCHLLDVGAEVTQPFGGRRHREHDAEAPALEAAQDLCGAYPPARVDREQELRGYEQQRRARRHQQIPE